jgi:hypothetical protein
MFALVVLVTPLVVWIAVSLSGPMVWASLAVASLISLAVYAWRRRIESARERAWVGELSFGDVVDRMRAREALDL